jgi:hypothetical protein
LLLAGIGAAAVAVDTSHKHEDGAKHFARALHAALQIPTETDESDGNERKDESEKSLDVRQTRVLPIVEVGDAGLEPATSTL